ncbi:hypothetical protein [Streptomyces sp. NPDC048737]
MTSTNPQVRGVRAVRPLIKEAAPVTGRTYDSTYDSTSDSSTDPWTRAF